MKAFVEGTGFWSPGFPSPDAWLARNKDLAAMAPPCTLCDSRLLRGTSLLTRMSVEVATQAIQAAGWQASDVAAVFGSAHGEMSIALRQLDMMAQGDGTVSPMQFKNSVHNTGAGVFSIAAGNRGFSTAIAAGEETFSACLIEAFGLLSSGHSRVVVVVADESLPPPISTLVSFDSCAVAFALSATAMPTGLGDIDLPLRSIALQPSLLAGNPAAAALPLLESLMRPTLP